MVLESRDTVPVTDRCTKLIPCLWSSIGVLLVLLLLHVLLSWLSLSLLLKYTD